MKIILIQVWLGKIPDYFWFHYETTKNLKNIDFLFFTDQDLINFGVFYISDVFLDKKIYIIEIFKSNSRNKIYHNFLKI